MYKIFYNNKIVYLSEEKITTMTATKIHFSDDKNIETALKNFLYNDLSGDLNIYGYPPLHELPANFVRYFRLIRAAGGIITDEPRRRLLYIRRRGVNDLPKGKLEPCEIAPEAAVREVCEECGIKKNNLSMNNIFYDRTFHIYVLETENVLKQNEWFSMTLAGHDTLVPQTEEEITEVNWLSLNDLRPFFANTYPSVADLMRKYIAGTHLPQK